MAVVGARAQRGYWEVLAGLPFRLDVLPYEGSFIQSPDGWVGDAISLDPNCVLRIPGSDPALNIGPNAGCSTTASADATLEGIRVPTHPSRGVTRLNVVSADFPVEAVVTHTALLFPDGFDVPTDFDQFTVPYRPHRAAASTFGWSVSTRLSSKTRTSTTRTFLGRRSTRSSRPRRRRLRYWNAPSLRAKARRNDIPPREAPGRVARCTAGGKGTYVPHRDRWRRRSVSVEIVPTAIAVDDANTPGSCPSFSVFATVEGERREVTGQLGVSLSVTGVEEGVEAPPEPWWPTCDAVTSECCSIGLGILDPPRDFDDAVLYVRYLGAFTTARLTASP